VELELCSCFWKETLFSQLFYGRDSTLEQEVAQCSVREYDLPTQLWANVQSGAKMVSRLWGFKMKYYFNISYLQISLLCNWTDNQVTNEDQQSYCEKIPSGMRMLFKTLCNMQNSVIRK
jgi:hypothetical protein